VIALTRSIAILKRQAAVVKHIVDVADRQCPTGDPAHAKTIPDMRWIVAFTNR